MESRVHDYADRQELALTIGRSHAIKPVYLERPYGLSNFRKNVCQLGRLGCVGCIKTCSRYANQQMYRKFFDETTCCRGTFYSVDVF